MLAFFHIQVKYEYWKQCTVASILYRIGIFEKLGTDLVHLSSYNKNTIYWVP